MKIKHLLITVLLLIQAVTLFGQKIKVTSGDLKFLKKQKNINILYDYSEMGVGKYEYEEDYVHDRVLKLNGKEAGKGDEWKAAWIADRKERFEPSFEELINKALAKRGVIVGNFENSEYTLILKTTFTEPGFNVGVVRKNAYTNMEAFFVKTGTTEPITIISLQKAPAEVLWAMILIPALEYRNLTLRQEKDLANT